MKFLNSKKGFTLIELLVVIGILAVLAAIAIPSVAGLIDRANVSADQTNANEMTNAMERFVSEYELYRQDIASGLIKDENDDGVPDNLDAAQGRVYNVTGAVTMDDIRKLESETGFNGIRIDITNKYAQNHETAKAVMQNYMKTSSTTFEPKQSDMSYWYNSLTGYTIVAETDIDTAELYKYLPVDVEYTNATPASISEWVNLSSNYPIPDFSIVKIHQSEELDADGHNRACIHLSHRPFDIESANGGKLYVIWSFFEEEPEELELTFENCSKKFYIGYMKEEISMCNGFYSLKIKGYSNETHDDFDYYRLCYEYIEDGQTKYAYSGICDFSYEDLPQ